MTRKTRANRKASTSSDPSFESDRFPSMKNQELFETLNLKRKIWTEHKVLLDELDPAIRSNFEHLGWLSLLYIDHPPPATLIREFYSNLSIHVYDSNILVKSWIRGVEFTITPSVVADALGVPVVSNPIYPYDESPSLDDIMSYITGSSIRWGFDPRITSAELTETTYLSFRIVCHSLWPISHLHTIPLERCAFLYALVMDAPFSFPLLFLRSLNEVHRSSSTVQALFHPVFIHRILLFLGLDDFPTSETIHIVAPISATYLRQKVTQLRPPSKCPRVEPSGTAPPPFSTIGTASSEASADPVDAAATAAVPPPFALDVFNIRRTLETVMTIQAAHVQLLVDMLDEIRALRADLEHLQCSPSPPPFDDGL